MSKLKIKGLLINVGYAESARLSTLIVKWWGTPFTEPLEAIKDFYKACLAQCVETTNNLDECCAAQLKVKPDSKACPECGKRLGGSREMNFGDYLRKLHRTDNDGFPSTAYPFNDPPENEGDPSYNLLGNWSLTGELPTEGHVVVVEDMDSCAGGLDEVAPDYVVVKIGKRVG